MGALTPDEARLVERIVRLPKQQRALERALDRYRDDQGEVAEQPLQDAFYSGDEDDILAIWQVTSGFQSLVNHLTEMMLVGARCVGLPVVAAQDVKPPVPELAEAVANAGGLTTTRADQVSELARMRNSLQHSSPSVRGSDFYEQLMVLRRIFTPTVRQLVEWLQEEGVQLKPS